MSDRLGPNTPLSHYRIVHRLGAGGMGEVYRARDTRLDRVVAIKFLPSSFSTDEDRLRRFELEARATSALNHPNILTVHDFGLHNAVPYIVAELLEGEELRARIQDGPLPVSKALDYARQIAAGLAAAHGKGIVHRDLKPENLFVTGDGRVKILDFGLAKLEQPGPAATPNSVARTEAVHTDPGTVLGTVGYMSPEQVRAQATDHRTDIFSFGVILYEMLAGRRAFAGPSAAETMAAIVREEPPELSTAGNRVPPQLERIARRCMEKRPEQRFQSASDLGFALESVTSSSSSDRETKALPVSRTALAREKVWIAVAALAVCAALGFAWAYYARQPEGNEAAIRLSLLPPEGSHLGHLVVSPDGRWLAFPAITGGKDQLWVRPLEGLAAQPLAGTEGASFPFWSPDSRFLGFFAAGKLKKIAITGGPAQTLCDVLLSAGGAWHPDGRIFFTMLGFGLFQVSSAGGEAAIVLPIDRSRLEWNFHSPSFLPDRRHLLFYIQSGRKETRGVYIGSVDGQLKQRVIGANSNALYGTSSTGDAYLLFLQDETLVAQLFDPSQLKLTGEPRPLSEDVGSDPNFPRGNFSISENGILVYDGNAGRQRKRHIWVDRQGNPIASSSNVGGWSNPALSPDERQVMVDRIDTEADTRDLWLQPVVGGGSSRFTFDPADDVQPIWSPDGTRIVWASNRGGTFNLYQKPATGAGQDELVQKSDILQVPTGWSPDGHFILYYEVAPKTHRDIWVLPVTGQRQPRPVLRTEANETGAQLSPDGRWLAYASDETGTYEVYVQGFPSGGSQRQISIQGGVGPQWRRDGKELFYFAPDGNLMSSDIKSGESFKHSPPRSLFAFRSGNGLAVVAPYAASADGQRFVLNTVVHEPGVLTITAVVNWSALIVER